MTKTRHFPQNINPIDCHFMGAPLFLYLIRGETLTLIDSGIRDTPERFVFPYLRRYGFTPADLSAVVVTHAHHDHFGGNGQIRAANPEIAILAPELECEWIEDSRRHFNEMYRSFPGEWEPDADYEQTVLDMCGECVPVARILRDGEALRLEEATVLTCLSVPSHSKGHMMFVMETERTCFVGDAIQGEGTKLANGTTVFPLYDDVGMYLSTLETIASVQADWICTGHFGVLDREGTELRLEQSRRQTERHSDYVANALARAGKPLSLQQLVHDVHELHYRDYECAYQMFATTHAHCRHLQKLGEAERIFSDGRLLWGRVH